MKRKKVWKRTLAALLTLAMALGVVPMTAFAEETSQTAADAAAMQALESRVFTIADEEYTIEDLEETTTVIVTNDVGENISVSSNEIRAYLLANPRVTITATITTSTVYTGNSNYAYIKISVTSSQLFNKITAEELRCRLTLNPYTDYYYSAYKEWKFSSTNTFSVVTGVFRLPVSREEYSRIYYDPIIVYAVGGSTFVQSNKPYIV